MLSDSIQVASCESAATLKVAPEREVDVRREQQRHGRDAEGRVAHEAHVVRQEQHQDSAEQRDEDGDGRDHRRDPTAKAAMVISAMMANTRNAYCAPAMIPMIRTLSRMNNA